MIKKLFLLSILTLAMAGCSDSGLATELITKSTEATTEELKCGNDHSDYRGLKQQKNQKKDQKKQSVLCIVYRRRRCGTFKPRQEMFIYV
ncbi:TPA: hypothetical protein QFG41_001340 [Enterococcus faecium]|nr:hypothetical protein [Enterococcus faecium]HAR1321513.1 hypothetical protein [Enterococcus faecium]HAR1354428.1 hypothetical protein [Enterococcus faecium]